MSRPSEQAGKQEKVVTAFEVDVEMLWLRLTRLPLGTEVNVWLAPPRFLSTKWRKGSHNVGTYNKEATLSGLREDCFWTLEQAMGRR